MNAESAYEQHTDLVRALSRAGSPERRWFEDYLQRHRSHDLRTGERLPWVAFSDPMYLLSQVRAGQEEQRVSLVAGFEPTTAQEDAVEVGVVDPERLRAELAGEVPPGDDVPDTIAVPLEILTNITAAALAKAPTVYVTADMVTVLEAAAAALDETDMMPYHPGYPSGFVVLARPLRLPYGDGTDQIVHAFGWNTLPEVRTGFGGVGKPGIVWQFVDRQQAPEDRAVHDAEQRSPSRRAWADSPALVLNIADWFVTGTPVGEMVEPETGGAAARTGQALLEALNAPEAVERPMAQSETRDGPVVGRFQPYLAAMLLLLSQEIVATRREPVHDYARKRARRAGRPSDGTRGSSVTVVDLAPRKHRSEEGEAGEPGHRLTNRHLVGGHWKWQPYGSDRRLRRRIYVANYVRGPEDTPLVVKPRVQRLSPG